jgi:hypothetical protein
MRHLDSRLIEGLLDEMAADSLLRIAGGAREGKDAETTGTLDFIIRCESTTGEREFGAADPSRMLRRKHFPLLVHITPRGWPVIPGGVLRVVDPKGMDTYSVGLRSWATTGQVATEGPYRVHRIC